MTDNLLDTDVGNPSLDPEKDYYSELVGEGKKFKDNQALAYSKMHADLAISLKDRQLDQMRVDLESARAEAAARARVEDLVKQLNNPNSNPPTVITETPKPEINMDQIESLVDKRIQVTEQQKRQQDNLNMVKAELTKRFGSNLEDHLKEVGLDGESAAQLAKVNPQLVLKALGVDKTPDPYITAPPRNTSVNTSNRAAEQRDWNYYQKLFKAQPNLKYDPKINTQMQKDYAALGSAFETGDFHRFG